MSAEDIHTAGKLSGKKTFTYLIIIIALTVLDQITKKAAVAHLMGSDPYVILDNILELLYVENRGAAFGMMKGMRGFFLLLAPLVSICLFALLIRMPNRLRGAGAPGGEDPGQGKPLWPVRVCFLLVIAGAAGNFIDRLLNGYVVDFIYFMPIDFPVFNVADIYVTCASFALAYLLIFYYSDEDLGQMFPGFGGRKNGKPEEHGKPEESRGPEEHGEST